MNTRKHRIAGMVAAGLLAMSGVAIAQPAYAQAKQPATSLERFASCQAAGGSFKACCKGVGGSYEAEYDENGRLTSESCSIAGREVPSTKKPNAGTGVVVNPVTPVAQPTPTPTTPTRPATGIVVKPGGTIG